MHALILALVASQVHIDGPDSLIQESMAPDGGGVCSVFMDGDSDVTNATTDYFTHDLDADGTVDAGETYIFRNGSRWRFQAVSGSGIVTCCLTDSTTAQVVAPDSLPEHGRIVTSSTAVEGAGHCITLGTAAGYDDARTLMIQRHLQRASTSVEGLYGGVCTSTVAGVATATTAYPGSGMGPIYKGCENIGDCSDADGVNVITFGAAANVSHQCKVPATRRDHINTGVLIACNGSADVDVIACELP